MLPQIPLPAPGKTLLHLVRARFTERGESLHGWCRRNGVDWGYASRTLTGAHEFPAAKKLRKRIIDAAMRTECNQGTSHDQY